MAYLTKYNVAKTYEKKLGETSTSTLKFTLKTGKAEIAVQDVKDLLKGLEAESKKRREKTKYMVRVANIKGIYTVKSFDGEMHLAEYLDYYAGKVSNTAKFEKLASIEITQLKY